MRLERALAEWKGTEAALCFSSGYAAALGTIPALVSKSDVVLLDKLCHASLIDAAKLSGAILRVFPHNNLRKLESHLEWARREHAGKRVLIVTESVFSMDGDRAPLHELVELKKRFDALLMLDEAHAVGVIGLHGRGLAAEENLSDNVDVQMGTMSKALGAMGGYICGSHDLIEWLINRARSFIYSTASPPAIAAAASAAIDFLSSQEGEERRLLLWKRIQLMQELLQSLDVGRWALDVGMLAANAQRPTLNAQRSKHPRARSFRCSSATSRRRSIWPLHSKAKASSSQQFVIRPSPRLPRVCALPSLHHTKKIKSERSVKQLND